MVFIESIRPHFRWIGKCLPLAISLGCLVSCASVQPPPNPPMPVTQAWPANLNLASPEASSKLAAQVHWRSYFIDPRLQALIESSLKNNRDLRMAVARVQEARAQYQVALADEWPTLMANTNYAINSTPANVSGGVPSKSLAVNLAALSYEVDFWGRIASLSESAKSSYLATDEARRNTELALIAEVANAYFNLRQLEEMQDFTATITASREVSYELVLQAQKLGGSYDFEVEQQRGLMETAKGQLASLDHQVKVAQNLLNFLVGDATQNLPSGIPLSQALSGVLLSPGVPSEVLLMRPDVMAAEHRLVAAHADIQAARAAFFPKVSLTGALGLASPGLAGLFSGRAWSFAPAMTLPIFDRGRLQASLDIAEARKNGVVADYEKTIQQAFREVSDQLSARSSLERQLHAAVQNEAAQRRRLLVTQGRYKAGLIAFPEYLEVERENLQALQNTAQVRHAQLEAATLLYKALGGGVEPATSVSLASP